MPILHIKALPQQPGVNLTLVMKKVCLELAAVMNLPPRQVWGTWQTLDAGQYVEGEVEAALQPHSTHPPLVELIAFEGRSPEVIEAMLNCVAQTLGRELKIERGNVFITYREARSGRTFTGGEIRRVAD